MSYVIVTFVAYTEIDYQAYMEQCYLFLQENVRDYYFIRGQTGPLVYPAGFLYLYSTLQYLTGYTATVSNTSTSSTGDAVVTDGIHHHHNSNNNNNEHAVRMAQYIFILFYAATQCLVFFIYYHSTTRILQQSPSSQPQRSYSIWKFRSVLLLLCLSKRLHSIYVLRLFNDGVTMLFLYASMYLLIRAAARPTQQQTLWNWGCVVFSLAVSIKMNVLLFAPGLLLLLLHVSDSWTHCIVRIIGYCGIPQLLLGFPFLRQHPVHYIHKAFEFDRTFFYIWTVNWKVSASSLLVVFVVVVVVGIVTYHSSLLVVVFTRRYICLQTIVDPFITLSRRYLNLHGSSMDSIDCRWQCEYRTTPTIRILYQSPPRESHHADWSDPPQTIVRHLHYQYYAHQ